MLRQKLWLFCRNAFLPVLVLLVYGFIAFLCSHTPQSNQVRTGASAGELSYVQARVTDTDNHQVQKTRDAGLYTGVQVVTIQIKTGIYRNRRYAINNILNDETNYYLEPGESIIATVNIAAGTAQTPNISLYAPYRAATLIGLTIVFVVVFCIIGKWKGFRSIVGLIFTVVTLFFIFIPLLLEGVPTLTATGIAVSATVFSTAFLVTGWTRKSVASVVGILAGIGFSSLLLGCLSNLLHLSGYTMTDTYALLNLAHQSKLQIRFLLFSEIILASLGAVMDIAISITTSVDEVFIHHPGADFFTLFHSGMRVGRDIMGTMVNTLLLAFIGTSLSTFLLFYAGPLQTEQIFNADTVTMQILQILCSGLTLVVTVPVVSAISAKLISSNSLTRS